MSTILSHRIPAASLLFGEDIVAKMIAFVEDYGEHATYNCCLRASGSTLRDCLAILTNPRVYPTTTAQLLGRRDLLEQLRSME